MPAAPGPGTTSPGRTSSPGPALALLAVTQFVLILDAAIVGVALPSIARQLHFTQSDLSWVTNGYALLFGGFLLLGGRLADLLGRRRLFIGALILFVVASGAAALSPSAGWLVAFRGLQGLTAAIASPAALSLLLVVFPDGTDEEKAARGKALGVWAAVGGAGGAVGYILGGVLTDLMGWQSVFSVNVPIGLAAALLAARLLPAGAPTSRGGRFDVLGAATVTAGLILVVYVTVDASTYGWTSARTIGLGAAAVALILLFLLVEARSRQPLVPLGIFRRRALRGANLVGVLMPAAFTPTFFFLSLYTQFVYQYSPLRAGLALLPIAVVIVASAMNASKVLGRVSLRAGAGIGLLLVATGLFWLSRIGGHGYLVEIIGPEILVGIGGGLAFVAVTVAGTSGVGPEESGLASGLLNTSQQVGGALGLAALASIATSATARHGGAGNTAGLTYGYHVAFAVATGVALVALLAALVLLPGKARAAVENPEAAGAAPATDAPLLETGVGTGTDVPAPRS
ncbi:MFS transporter [Dactylosporangium sp. NPDC051485]|uniref:MFS transporter n=1 Tax=Dactylosporangium sp. NPDC051485 TaxID=3154846 RepID=UPI00341DDB47